MVAKFCMSVSVGGLLMTATIANLAPNWKMSRFVLKRYCKGYLKVELQGGKRNKKIPPTL